MKICLFCFVFALFSFSAIAQNAALRKQLDESRNLSTIMKTDSADAGMTRWLKKKVEKSRELPLAADFDALVTKGPGTISIDHTNTISGNSEG